MKKENNIILCGIAIAVLASAGFAMSQGTISSADDNYVTPKHVIEEPKEDLELEEDAIEDVEEEKDEIRIYYGACDECIGLATGSFSELMNALKK